ncbi:MAG TPA: fibronectin type III domain-containing protein [Solirubrobacterales bacterium]|nr:fibronectin type III domain-containing protein [Solirubrobacterales bacterium]
MRRHAKAIVAISALLLLTCALGAMSATAAASVVSMGSVSAVGYTTAHVTGTVDPEDNETYYSFEYTNDPKAGWSGFNFEGPLAGGSGPTNVEADLANLVPGTEYFVRLSAWNFIDAQLYSQTVQSFQTDPVAPPTVSISAPTQVTDSSAHFEGEITPGGTDPAFGLIWHFQCTPACPGLEGSLDADNSSHTVEADATNLKPGTAYQVSLVAQSSGAEASAGPESFSTDTRAPKVLSTSVSALSTEATLKGQVDPGGLAASYHFEYGASNAYGQSTPTKSIAAGASPVAAKADLSGLSPNSGYHFKLVVENADGSDTSADGSFLTLAPETPAGGCPNEAVRIQQSAQTLPDCRAYELVSPTEKGNGDVSPYSTTRSTPDGEGLEYEALTAFAGAEGSAHANQYTAWRSSTGWTTEPLNPYQAPDPFRSISINEGYYGFTEDLSKGILFNSHDPSDRSGYSDSDQKSLYMYRKSTRSFVRISPPALSKPELQWRGPGFLGSSTDMSRVFFESREQLTPDAPPSGTPEAYEWHEGAVQVVGVLPNGAIASEGARVGRGVVNEMEGLANSGKPDSQQAISGDGTQVVFASGSPEQLYLREGGHSRLISTSVASGEEGTPAPDGATFLGSASEDGRKLSTIYFVSPDLLTDDATGDPSGNLANELYEYDVETGDLTFLSKDTNHSDPAGAGVYPKWVAASDNGEYAYFIAEGALTPDASLSRNLYLAHDGEVTFLGKPTWSPNFSAPEPFYAWISPDGKRLLYLSNAPLSPEAPRNQDNLDATPEQAYLYDAPSGEWRCVSCNQHGETVRPSRFGLLGGRQLFGTDDIEVQGSFGGSEFQQYAPRVLSADGSRVFFETANPLVARDANGAADVYEWHNGRIEMISSGREPSGAHFLDASTDGRDVFIATREQLVGADKDHNMDVYDIRKGGGFLEPSARECEGDACQRASSGGSPWVAPGTAGVAGAGNPAKRVKGRCAKARKGRCAVKRKGRCSKRERRCSRNRHAKNKGGKR